MVGGCGRISERTTRVAFLFGLLLFVLEVLPFFFFAIASSLSSYLLFRSEV
jgi:hypothetical protein